MRYPQHVRDSLQQLRLLPIVTPNGARIALAAGQVNAMHDPTEGGLATGLHELAEAEQKPDAEALDRAVQTLLRGWLAGRSTPTDGSGLAAGDSDGVECDYCHKLTNPDDSEHLGNQFDPFRSNSEENPAPEEGYYGSGMSSMWGGSDKLGPYNDAEARHQFMQSEFHRDVDFCGTCHDVSNPVTGDLAHNNGAFQVLDAGSYSGVPDSDVAGKAAFNNAPYSYGIVERTFSEHMSSPLSTVEVDAFPDYRADCRDESLSCCGRGCPGDWPPHLA